MAKATPTHQFNEDARTISAGPQLRSHNVTEYTLSSGGNEWTVTPVPLLAQTEGGLSPFLLGFRGDTISGPTNSTLPRAVTPEHLAISVHFGLGMTVNGKVS